MALAGLQDFLLYIWDLFDTNAGAPSSGLATAFQHKIHFWLIQLHAVVYPGFTRLDMDGG